MNEFVLALFVALTGWWFSTGVILWLVHRPERYHRNIFGLATITMLVAFYGVQTTVTESTPQSVVTAFCLALLLWGWLEMGYLMGFVTGPRKEACPDGATAVARMRLGLRTCIWHELTLLVMVAVLAWLSWRQANQTALWAFTVLWLMRWSSKLNLVLGVRNYNQSWLPERLAYVHSYIPRRLLNPLFPFSVTCGVIVSFYLINAAIQATDLGLMIALTLAGAIAALGTLEHLFLMAPLKEAALWIWAAPTPTPSVTKTRSQSQ